GVRVKTHGRGEHAGVAQPDCRPGRVPSPESAEGQPAKGRAVNHAEEKQTEKRRQKTMMTSPANRRPGFVGQAVLAAVFLAAFCLDFSSYLGQPRLLRVAQAQGPSPAAGELTVFAAVSLTEPFTEIGKRLELSHPGLKVV